MKFSIKGKRLIGHTGLLDYYEDTKGNTYAYNGKKVVRLSDSQDIYTANLVKAGENNGLEGSELHTFIAFMKQRFPNEKSESYIDEWAKRFAMNKEWISADNESQKVLKEVNFAKYYNYK